MARTVLGVGAHAGLATVFGAIHTYYLGRREAGEGRLTHIRITDQLTP